MNETKVVALSFFSNSASFFFFFNKENESKITSQAALSVKRLDGVNEGPKHGIAERKERREERKRRERKGG